MHWCLCLCQRPIEQFGTSWRADGLSRGSCQAFCGHWAMWPGLETRCLSEEPSKVSFHKVPIEIGYSARLSKTFYSLVLPSTDFFDNIGTTLSKIPNRQAWMTTLSDTKHFTLLQGRLRRPPANGTPTGSITLVESAAPSLSRNPCRLSRIPLLDARNYWKRTTSQ